MSFLIFSSSKSIAKLFHLFHIVMQNMSRAIDIHKMPFMLVAACRGMFPCNFTFSDGNGTVVFVLVIHQNCHLYAALTLSIFAMKAEARNASVLSAVTAN